MSDLVRLGVPRQRPLQMMQRSRNPLLFRKRLEKTKAPRRKKKKEEKSFSLPSHFYLDTVRHRKNASLSSIDQSVTL